MDRDRDRAHRSDHGDEDSGSGVAVGRRSRVASEYPHLARALGPNPPSAPSIDDVATAAVERKGGGAPVDAGVASTVGAHLGHDFSAVRVHGDPLAREASAAMGAQAFAYGSDVFLGPGASGTDLGLMAHELTHVAQQGAAGRRGAQAKVEVGAADTPAEREADQVAAAVTGGATPASLLVDDGPPAAGQMLKSTFIAQLRAAVTDAADTELGPMYSALGCPYIDMYFQRYSDRPASESEALLRRFAPAVRGARQAADMIPIVVERVRQGVRQWRDDGTVPPDLAAADPAAAAGAAASHVGGSATLGGLEADLGAGRALDASTASRMSEVLGQDVSDVRIHDGAVAARKAAEVDATAFAVGRNVVLGADAPAAGSLEGDALLAHELAHTAQQHAAASAPAAMRAPIGAEDHAAEDHADEAAAAAVGQRVGLGGWLRRIGAGLRTDVQLQRCKSDKQATVDKATQYRNRIAELQKTEAAKGSFGSVAAAMTERRATEHWLAVEEGGSGPRTGRESGETGVTCDCTTLVVDILQDTFAALGKSADWDKVKTKALSLNGTGQTGMNGIPIQRALESELGWKGVFWAPDPNFAYKKSNGDAETEHSYAYSVAKNKGTYYKVSVDHTVVNFAPESGSSTTKDDSGLGKLKKIPFGVLTARGARHMALIVAGVVYEVHWDEKANSANLYGATPLESWGWDSGAIVAPPNDIAEAFK
jgi:hypothetical protein